jgi:hypothetical protein
MIVHFTNSQNWYGNSRLNIISFRFSLFRQYCALWSLYFSSLQNLFMHCCLLQNSLAILFYIQNRLANFSFFRELFLYFWGFLGGNRWWLWFFLQISLFAELTCEASWEVADGRMVLVSESKPRYVTIINNYSALSKPRYVTIINNCSALSNPRHVTIINNYSALSNPRHVSIASNYSALSKAKYATIINNYSALSNPRSVTITSNYSALSKSW